jgi:branched-subunit amino acid transport protein
MASDSADDILEWLDQLQLPKRKQNFLKNIPASVADCVLVADIIHVVFPKIIQVQQYPLISLT